MEIRGIVPGKPEKAQNLSPARQQEDKKLQEACKQFETIFLSQMLTQMRKSIPKGKLFGKSREEDMYQDMLAQEQAKVWAESGGIGLSNLLYQQLRKFE